MLSDCLSPLCHIAAARSTCPAVISLAWLLANGHDPPARKRALQLDMKAQNCG